MNKTLEDLKELGMEWPRRTRPVAAGLRYSEAEFKAITLGHQPASSDEKWLLLFDDGRLLIFRAPARLLLYECHFEAVPEGHRLVRIDVNADGKPGEFLTDRGAPAMVWFLIECLLLRKVGWEDFGGLSELRRLMRARQMSGP